jgi:adenylate kinase family enzyme
LPEAPPVVPTIVITGPSGVGKSTILKEVSLHAAYLGIPHGAIDVDYVTWVPSASVTEVQQLRVSNVAGLWQSYVAAGATHLALAAARTSVPTRASYTEWLSQAIPNARFTVFRLHASLDVLHARRADRELGSGSERPHRRYARKALQLFERNASEDHLIETSGRGVREIATQIMQLSGWEARCDR